MDIIDIIEVVAIGILYIWQITNTCMDVHNRKCTDNHIDSLIDCIKEESSNDNN